MGFDLLLAGGEVVDPGGRSGRLDVGLSGGRVSAVAPALPRDDAREVVDCAGLLVAPGLVDLHTHVGAGLTFWGLDPDPHAATAGTTTWVDAGSAGAYGLAGLRRHVADAARVRVLALINISSIGLVAPSWELARPAYLDEGLCVDVAERHRGFVVGVKARIDRFTVGSLGLEPLRAAVRVARRLGLPLMVHIAHGPPAIDAVLELLGPGDIVTHCATPASMRLLEDSGQVRPAVRDAVARGVVLDLGHGSGAFSFPVAEALLAAGLRPVVSSDAHQLSVNGPMFDLATCLTKLLALGLALEDALAAATALPARAIGRGDLGTLEVGSPADVVLLALEDRPMRISDTTGETRIAPRRLRVECVLAQGRELPRRPLPPPAPWVALSPRQAAARAAAARGEDVDLPTLLADPADLAAPPLVDDATEAAPP